jgi:hypothetical protein
MTRDARTVFEAKIKSELGGQGDTAMGHSTSQNSTKEKEGESFRCSKVPSEGLNNKRDG